MKICGKCKEEKPFSEFHKKGDGYQSRCKPCNIASRVQYYRDNSEKEKTRNEAWYIRHRHWYMSLKTDIPCVDCEQIFPPVAMQWDHKPGVDKVGDVSTLFRNGRSKQVILDEIAKCDLRCANCHAIRTWPI